MTKAMSISYCEKTSFADTFELPEDLRDWLSKLEEAGLVVYAWYRTRFFGIQETKKVHLDSPGPDDVANNYRLQGRIKIKGSIEDIWCSYEYTWGSQYPITHIKFRYKGILRDQIVHEETFDLVGCASGIKAGDILELEVSTRPFDIPPLERFHEIERKLKVGCVYWVRAYDKDSKERIPKLNYKFPR